MNTATQLLEQCRDLLTIGSSIHTDIEAYLAKQQVEQEPVYWDVIHNGSHVRNVHSSKTEAESAMHRLNSRYEGGRKVVPLYTQPSGALIVHKGCKATWANGVIEVMPVAREPISEQAIDDLLENLGDHNNGGVAEDNIIPFVRAIEQHHNIGAKQ